MILQLFSMCLLSTVLCYPDYIPELACEEMFPVDHGVHAKNHQAATATPPYLLTVNATSYRPGDVIEIFLNSSKPASDVYGFYEGALVEARRSDCSHSLYKHPVGEFFLKAGEDFLETMTCSQQQNSAVRHMAHAHIYNNTIYWRAPPSTVGHIYFRGTVARRQSEFWTNVNSVHIRDSSSTVTLPTSYCKPRTDYKPCSNTDIPKGPTGGASSYNVFHVAILIMTLLPHFTYRKVY